MIGLVGAHRVGKTTMAREASRVIGLPFLETSVSSVFESLGLDPAAPMDFRTRLMVQHAVLKFCIEKWQGHKDGFLSDRTPIDMMAYTLADVQGNTLGPTEEALLANYMRLCAEACNNHFGMLMLIQPGIKIVPAPGKAALSKGYMEHLNAVMMGLLSRKDIKPDVTFLRRDTLDLNERVNCLVHIYKRMIKQEFQHRITAATLH